jgi:hypothetical protein
VVGATEVYPSGAKLVPKKTFESPSKEDGEKKKTFRRAKKMKESEGLFLNDKRESYFSGI